MNAFEHENTIFGAFGEFDLVSEDVDWAEHDAEAEAYFAELSAVSQGFYDDDPSPYDGTYSEM